MAKVLARLYALGIKPDWWKLEAQNSAAAWHAIEKTVEVYDPYCRGIVMLGLEAPESELAAAFRIAAGAKMVKGFAVGRTIFADAADQWLSGKMTDEEAVADMAAQRSRASFRYGRRPDMSRLLVKPRAERGKVIRITPQSAGWKHVGFEVHQLAPGESVAARPASARSASCWCRARRRSAPAARISASSASA